MKIDERAMKMLKWFNLNNGSLNNLFYLYIDNDEIGSKSLKLAAYDEIKIYL